MRCRASPAAPLRCWTLHSADAYGNVRSAGGEVVSASHAAKGGRRGNPARVKDNGNGTYALRCGT